MDLNLPMTLLEEFLLLALDDQTGQLHPLAPSTLDCAVAGTILMDLTLRNHIDNDLRDMFVVDQSPTGDNILDPALQVMSLAPVLTPHPIAYWLRHFRFGPLEWLWRTLMYGRVQPMRRTAGPESAAG